MDDWGDAEQHVERAHELFELGRWEEAEAELRRALALDPSQADWHFNLGLTLEAAGRLREAVIAYRAAHELDPRNTNPLINLGVIHTELGDPEAALEALQRAQKMSPELETAYCPQILALAMIGRHEEAEQVYYMARLIKEECPICCFNLGNSLLERDLFDKAIWCFKEAARLDPRLPRVHARLGLAYAMQGKFEQAIRLFLRDLREDPGNIETLLELGKLLVAMGRLQEAAEKFRRVLELEPANPYAHFELGKLAIATRRFDRARVEFNLVLRLDPEFPGVPLQLAIASAEIGMAGEARRHLRTALEDAFEDGTDLHLLAELLVAVDMKFEAAEVLKTLITRHPDDAEAHHRLGCLMLRLGRHADGIASERRALRLDREHINALHNLLLAYVQTGRRARARVIHARAEKLAPRDAAIRRLYVRLQSATLLSGVSGLACHLWRRYRAAALRRRQARRIARERDRLEADAGPRLPTDGRGGATRLARITTACRALPDEGHRRTHAPRRDIAAPLALDADRNTAAFDDLAAMIIHPDDWYTDDEVEHGLDSTNSVSGRNAPGGNHDDAMIGGSERKFGPNTGGDEVTKLPSDVPEGIDPPPSAVDPMEQEGTPPGRTTNPTSGDVPPDADEDPRFEGRAG